MLTSLEEKSSHRHNRNKISFCAFEKKISTSEQKKDWTRDKGRVRGDCFNPNLTVTQEVKFFSAQGKEKEGSYMKYLGIHMLLTPIFYSFVPFLFSKLELLLLESIQPSQRIFLILPPSCPDVRQQYQCSNHYS